MASAGERETLIFIVSTPTPPPVREQRCDFTRMDLMNTYRFEISCMSSEACIDNVKSVLAGVDGVMARAVWLGRAILRCESQSHANAASAALLAAGYPAIEERVFECATPLVARSHKPNKRRNSRVERWVELKVFFPQPPSTASDNWRL